MRPTLCAENLMFQLGTPDRIRTCDLELRSLLLYPAELPGLDF